MALKDIPFIDNPELRIDEHESIEMPFRYVKGHDGNPIMPNVSQAQWTSVLCVKAKSVHWLLTSSKGHVRLDEEGLRERIRRLALVQDAPFGPSKATS